MHLTEVRHKILLLRFAVITFVAILCQNQPYEMYNER